MKMIIAKSDFLKLIRRSERKEIMFVKFPKTSFHCNGFLLFFFFVTGKMLLCVFLRSITFFL